MADPQHEPELDGFDRFTVRAYRAGLGLSALGVAALVGAPWLGGDGSGARAAVWVGVGLSVAHLHLYDKRVRWVIGAAGWTGAALTAIAAACTGAAAHWLSHAGLGFAFVVLSALALKERFCFRLPGLPLVPALLATSLVPLVAGWPEAAAVALAPAAVLLGLLALAKARMPLHYDVGDKSRYQV